MKILSIDELDKLREKYYNKFSKEALFTIILALCCRSGYDYAAIEDKLDSYLNIEIDLNKNGGFKKVDVVGGWIYENE